MTPSQSPAKAGSAERPVALPDAGMMLRFVLTLVSLQGLWSLAQDSALEHWVIDGVTVKTAAALIASLAPDSHVLAHGANLESPRGGIHVLNGCEGTELWFTWIAAILASPMRWPGRWLGVVLGMWLIFGLNQLRLLALFFSKQAMLSWFATLHGLVLPLLLMLATIACFALWCSWAHRRWPLAPVGGLE